MREHFVFRSILPTGRIKMSCKTAVILAAGAGTRMKSKKPKVLHELCGRYMVQHVISQVRKAGAEKIIVVVGHMADDVMSALEGEDNIEFALQKELKGTGHALMQTVGQLPDEGDVFVLCGDTPLITADSLAKFAERHEKYGGVLTVMSADVAEPAGYGRIVKGHAGDIIRIVEDKDASEREKSIKEVNSGIYCIDSAFIKDNINKLNNNNAQGEYYLTDMAAIAVSSGKGAYIYKIGDPDEIMGVNDRIQLREAHVIMQRRICTEHMRAGVTIFNPAAVYIEDGVKIGIDTEIWPGAALKGRTEIGENCTVGNDTVIENSIIGSGTDITKSVVKDSVIGSDTTVGPFAYIRPGSKVGSECRVGDFVEIKNSTFGDRSKSSHLAYIGDADVGEDVNIGCGVVFVNYDGVNKHRTTVGDRAFVGSNSNLVAPVTVGEDAYVAAGTTVTKNVIEGSLSIGRSYDKIEEGWVKKKGLLKSKRK